MVVSTECTKYTKRALKHTPPPNGYQKARTGPNAYAKKSPAKITSLRPMQLKLKCREYSQAVSLFYVQLP